VMLVQHGYVCELQCCLYVVQHVQLAVDGSNVLAPTFPASTQACTTVPLQHLHSLKSQFRQFYITF
jgi:hypothetical protein